MKKVTSAKFQKDFGKVADRLKAGESVQVTRHGKAIGKNQKVAAMPRRRIGNSLPKIKGDKVGQAILEKLNDSLS